MSLRGATVTREGVQAGTGAPEAQPGAGPAEARLQRRWCWRVPIALRVPPQTHLSGVREPQGASGSIRGATVAWRVNLPRPRPLAGVLAGPSRSVTTTKWVVSGSTGPRTVRCGFVREV